MRRRISTMAKLREADKRPLVARLPEQFGSGSVGMGPAPS